MFLFLSSAINFILASLAAQSFQSFNIPPKSMPSILDVISLNLNLFLGGLWEGILAIPGAVWMLGLVVDMMDLSPVMLGLALRQ